MKKILLVIVFISISVTNFAQQTNEMKVRLKDIASLIEARDNQLIGYGIVVGLRGTGDSRTGLTGNTLRNLLSKMGVSVSGADLNSRNVASVITTATLPPFIKKGQRISVTVSSLGNSTSLSGGTLIMTPLLGADMKTYAVAQGAIVVDGINESSSTGSLVKNQSTVGFISNGAIVEAEVPVIFSDQHNITIVLNEPNFSTVRNTAKAIQNSGFPGAKAIDATTIKIPLTDLNSSDLITTIAQIENIELVPDQSSKIVINSKTGTIIVGERVRLFPVAITHGGLSIKISNEDGGVFNNQTGESITITNEKNSFSYIPASTTLSNLVDSLNQIGASPKDLVSIFQALKESGALKCDLDIL
jgi:flagellar P-ring protein precursor FlgI